MAKNLQKTLKIENEDYNINAVYSDEAGKVPQALTINEFLSDGINSGIYNGSLTESTSTELNYVPATGGAFAGDVQINTPDEDITLHSVLNSEQISSRIELLTGNPLYTWDNGQLLEARNTDNQIYKINTVVGTTQDFYVFKNIFGSGSTGLRFTLHNIVNNSDYSNTWCEVAGYDGTETEVVIPYIYTYTDSYGSKHDIPVTCIGNSAFSDNKTIVNVTIPISITTIGERAFKNCTSLKKVELPNSINYIGYETFYRCSALTNITIPSSILRIGERAFYECTSFTAIIIPDTVLQIGESAFYGCSNVTNVSIGDGVTVIESGAFSGINAQVYTTDDAGLSYLGNANNHYLYAVTRISGKFPTTINNNCKIVGGGFSSNTSLTSIVIPNGVTYIGSSAFLGCSNLTNITIPDSIRGIGTDAFKNCTNLTYTSYDNAYYLGSDTNPYAALVKVNATANTITSCTIHENTKVICYSAFSGCTNASFKNITLPNGIRSLGEEAFYNCTRFTDIIIPDSVEFIDTGAFGSCSAIKNVTLGVGLMYIGADAFSSINRTAAELSYTGNDRAWDKIDVIVSVTSSTNANNKNNAFIVKELPEFLDSSISPYYMYDIINTSADSILNIKAVRDEPFIYICRDIPSGAGSSILNSANAIYLKLPNNDNIIEVSKGATRLDSVNNTSETQTYYTYEGLAEIIAKINSRLDGLGVKVNSTALTTLHTVTDVNQLVPEIEIKDDFDPESVLTVQQLNDKIDTKTTYDNPDPVLRTVGGISVDAFLVKQYEEDETTPKEYYSVKEILTKMLYPYTEPVITWDASEPITSSSGTYTSPTGIYEKGTTVNVSQVKFSVQKKTNDIISIKLYKAVAGRNPSDIKEVEEKNLSTSKDGVTFSDVDTISNSADTSYYVVVDDGREDELTVSTSKTITFVYPSYVGACDANEVITDSNNTITCAGLNPSLLAGKGIVNEFTYTNKAMVYAYPREYDALTSIKDPNGLEIKNSFSSSIINIKCKDGTTQEYYVYRSKINNTNSKFKVTFK